MIRYALACREGHDFESWFPSSASYDDQVARGLVECPLCGSAKVEKRIMAPALGRKGGSAPEPAPSVTDGAEPAKSDAPPPQPQPVAVLTERDQALRAMMRAVREHVTRTADYVGPSFAEQARKMHYGETPHRSIYGEASSDETKALVEEGIEFHPLPIAPDDRN
jgi:hypothetical protein